jgi:tetratricopeptide (TPR) repeat protein
LTEAQEADIQETLEVAAARFKEGDFQKAAQLIGLASDLDPSLEPPGVMMAKWAALAGKTGVARRLLDRAVIAHPGDPEPFFLLADMARMEGRRTEAMLLLGRGQELLEQFEGNAQRKTKIAKSMWTNLAEFAETQDKFDSALACLKKLEALAPESAEAHRRIGGLYFRRGEKGDVEVAREAFAKAFELDPQQLPPSAHLAKLHLQAGQVAEAAALLEEALAAHPEHLAALVLAANFYLGKGDVDKAKQCADSLAKIQPDSAAIQKLQGTLAFYRNELELAETEFRKALEKSPRHTEVTNLLAMVLLKQGAEEKIDEALDLAEANLRRASSQTTAATLAWALCRAGNTESAYRLLDQLLNRGNLDPNAAYFAAAIMEHKGNRKRAATLLEATLRSGIPFLMRADARQLLETVTAETTAAK